MTSLRPERPGSSPVFFIQMVFCSVLWAGAFPLMKIIGTDLSPVALSAVRGLLAAAMLAGWFRLRRQPMLPQGREWRDWMVLGLLQGALPNVLLAYALYHITSGLATMIEASCPLLVALASHWLFADERLDSRRAAGLAVGFSGMAVLLGPAALSEGEATLPAVLATLGAAVSYALVNLYIKAMPMADPARMALGQQLFSGGPLLVITLVWSGPAAFAQVPQHAVTLLVFGIFATALPMVVFMHVLRAAGPTLGSMIGYLIPLWTILMGFVFLGETVTLRQVAGGMVVLAGVGIVSSARRRRLALSGPA